MGKKYILKVDKRDSGELKKHTNGPGARYVFSDDKNNPEGNIYCIMRKVENVDNPEQHVQPHKHKTESLFVFKGIKKNLAGLEVEVLLGKKWHRVQSPAAISIPPNTTHAYRFIKGSGELWNILIAQGGNYNKTIRR